MIDSLYLVNCNKYFLHVVTKMQEYVTVVILIM